MPLRRTVLPIGVALAISVSMCSPGTSQSATLFGLVDTGEIFASTDSGTSWRPVAVLPVYDAAALAAGATASDLRVVTRSGIVFRSTDGGSDWIAVGTVGASDVVALTISPGLAVEALTESGTFYRSVDQGASFTAVSTLPYSDLVACARTGAQTLFALSRTGEIERSADGGLSWEWRGALPVSDAAALRAFGGALYAITGTGDLWKSVDEGTTWVITGTLSQIGVTSLTNDGSNLIAGIAQGAVAVSADGEGWSWVGTTDQVYLRSLGVDTPASASVPSGPEGTPRLRLGAASPNPASRADQLRLPILGAKGGEVLVLELVDPAGRRVALRTPERISGAGDQTLTWNPEVSHQGVYYLRLRTGAQSLSTPWVVIR